jgi:hypothetical protein
MRRPTKNLGQAIDRLERSACDLVCRGQYGGCIESDLLAVLRALQRARAADARTTATMRGCTTASPMVQSDRA